VEELSKICPLCFKTIRIDLQSCTFCGARFRKAEQGYCTNCHIVVQPARDGSCLHCSGPLIDKHMGDIVIPGSARPVGGALRKSRLRGLTIVAALALIVAALAMSYSLYREDIPALIGKIPFMATAQTPTRMIPPTRILTLTLIPAFTKTPLPTDKPEPTITPAPLAVDFNSILPQVIGTVVVLTGRLSMPQQTNCDNTTCWIYLRDPSKSSSKVIVYLRIPPANATASPRQMERLPQNYSFMHFKLRLDDGEWVGINTIVTIIGEVCQTKQGDVCLENISNISLAQ
jgi:hypothetical protein